MYAYHSWWFSVLPNTNEKSPSTQKTNSFLRDQEAIRMKWCKQLSRMETLRISRLNFRESSGCTRHCRINARYACSAISERISPWIFALGNCTSIPCFQTWLSMFRLSNRPISWRNHVSSSWPSKRIADRSTLQSPAVSITATSPT